MGADIYNPSNIPYGFDGPVAITILVGVTPTPTYYRITTGTPTKGSKQLEREDGKGLEDGWLSIKGPATLSGEIQLFDDDTPAPDVHDFFTLAFKTTGSRKWVILSVSDPTSADGITKVSFTARAEKLSVDPAPEDP